MCAFQIAHTITIFVSMVAIVTLCYVLVKITKTCNQLDNQSEMGEMRWTIRFFFLHTSVNWICLVVNIRLVINYRKRSCDRLIVVTKRNINVENRSTFTTQSSPFEKVFLWCVFVYSNEYERRWSCQRFSTIEINWIFYGAPGISLPLLPSMDSPLRCSFDTKLLSKVMTGKT